MAKTRYINHYSVEIDIKSDVYLKFDITRPANTDNWEGECNIYVIDLDSKEPEKLISEGLNFSQLKKLTRSLDTIIEMENRDD